MGIYINPLLYCYYDYSVLRAETVLSQWESLRAFDKEAIQNREGSIITNIMLQKSEEKHYIE